jgi:hypothetical protein
LGKLEYFIARGNARGSITEEEKTQQNADWESHRWAGKTKSNLGSSVSTCLLTFFEIWLKNDH